MTRFKEIKIRKAFGALLIALMVAAFTIPGWAQGSAESSVRGNLSGTVVDTSGAVVTGAKVTISGPTGTKSDNSNQDGQFLFPLLTPGFYGVKVEKGSFKGAPSFDPERELSVEDEALAYDYYGVGYPRGDLTGRLLAKH